MRLLIFIAVAVFALACARVDQAPPTISNAVPAPSLMPNTGAAPPLAKRDPAPWETVGFGKWPLDKCGEEETLAWKAETVDDPEESYGRGAVFTLTGKDGAVLYSYAFTYFVRVYEKTVVPGCPALFLVYNYGGTDNFMQALMIEDGKVVQLFDDYDTEEEVQLSGTEDFYGPPLSSRGVRSGAGPLPLQIFVSRDDGRTTIYRYDNGKFRVAEEFDSKKIAEYTKGLVKY